MFPVSNIVCREYVLLQGIRLQAIGLGVGIVTAAIFAFVIRTTGLVSPMIDLFEVSEIEGRLSPVCSHSSSRSSVRSSAASSHVQQLPPLAGEPSAR